VAPVAGVRGGVGVRDEGPRAGSDPGEEGRKRESRRPYSGPAIEWEERLEVWVNLSASCGKVAGETVQCTAVPGGS
jgi:hypothetical protein